MTGSVRTTAHQLVPLYRSRITDGSEEGLKEVNCLLRTGHADGRRGVGKEVLSAENERRFMLYVGGKNFTIIVWSIPGGGGRTSATLDKASSAD